MENVNSSGGFFDTISSKIETFVSKYKYQEQTEKFVNMSITQSFLKNELFLKINSWFEKNIVVISTVIGWIGIVGAVVIILSLLNLLLGIFGFLGMRFFLYLLLSLATSMIISFFTGVNGIGLISMKKWVPFTTIVLFFVSNGINILTYVFNIGMPYSYYYQPGTNLISFSISFFISLFLSFTCTCLVVHNRAKYTS